MPFPLTPCRRHAFSVTQAGEGENEKPLSSPRGCDEERGSSATLHAVLARYFAFTTTSFSGGLQGRARISQR